MTPRELLGALRERWTDLQGSVDGAEDGPGWMACAAELVGWLQGRLEAMAGPEPAALDSDAWMASNVRTLTLAVAELVRRVEAMAGPERAPEPASEQDHGALTRDRDLAVTERAQLHERWKALRRDIFDLISGHRAYECDALALRNAISQVLDKDWISRQHLNHLEDSPLGNQPVAEPAAEPDANTVWTSVSPGRLRRIAELERERDVALGERDAALRRIDSLRFALGRILRFCDTLAQAEQNARDAIAIDDKAAQQNTSGRHEPGAVEGPTS